MTTDRERSGRRFNPFANEADMFKVVVVTGVVVVAVILLVVLVRVAF